MQAHNDVLATLEAKSKQTTIEDLAKRGKKNVRVITGSDIREMVDRAIDNALAASDWIPPERLEEVKESAQQEFEAIQAQREQDRREAAERERELGDLQQTLLEAKERIKAYEDESSAVDNENAAALESTQQRVAELEEANGQLQASRDAFEGKIDEMRSEAEELERRLAEAEQGSSEGDERIAAAEQRAADAETRAAELERRCQSLHERALELEEQHRMLEDRLAERATLEDRLAEAELASEACEELDKRVKELEHELTVARQTPPPAPAPQADASAMLMMKLMEEIQTLKSQQGAAPQAPAQAAGGGELESKLAGIVGNLDAKLERLGKKMGVTSAVESDVDFNALVSRAMEEEQKLESNIDTVEVEKREGAGIAANLERIRKLKGGG